MALFQNWGESDTDKLNQDHLKILKYNNETFVWIKYTSVKMEKSLTENLYKH